MVKILLQFVRDENGATAVEYGVMVALIAVVIIGTVTILGQSISNLFGDDLSTVLENAQQ